MIARCFTLCASLAIQPSLRHMTPNHSLKRTRVRRASFGARRHGRLARFVRRHFAHRNESPEPAGSGRLLAEIKPGRRMWYG